VSISVPAVTELAIVGIDRPGVANEERILIRPTQAVNLGEFILVLGYQSGETSVIPALDQMFWFGEVYVEPPSWVIVHTGPGRNQETVWQQTGERLRVFYWGKSFTQFHVPGLMPVLMRIGAIAVGKPVVPRLRQQAVPLPAWARPQPDGQ